MSKPKGSNFYQNIMIPDEYHKDLTQPMIYTKGLSTVPCKPYVGCLFPTKNSMEFRQDLVKGIIDPFRPKETPKKTCKLS